MRRLIVGNWKMHGLAASLAEVDMLEGKLAAAPTRANIILCPPATLLAATAAKARAFASVGGQDCHAAASGAFTGDVSAEMLADAGAAYVIVGHSERRQGHGEKDADVRAKAAAALRAGLTPIICVGETLDERRAGAALSVLGRQWEGSAPASGDRRLVAAYEPVWAIGTGLTPTAAEIEEAHDFLRSKAGASVTLLYGGSVKPQNAAEILRLRNVEGVLVGGASLKSEEFFAIIAAAPAG